MESDKDPAILFYTSDFLTGTMTMSNEDVGKYIRLLCLQHQRGKLAEKDMLYICTTYVEAVFEKFVKDEQGFYQNKRLEKETLKRKKYCESRRKNIKKRYKSNNNKKITQPTYVVHMENENENENEDIIKDKNKNKNECASFELIWKDLPIRMRKGKKLALTHYLASVKNERDVSNLKIALKNYLASDRVKNGYIQNGSTWFNNWQDWIEEEPKKGFEKKVYTAEESRVISPEEEHRMEIEFLKHINQT